jgi:biotin carboxyl carrier protein
MKMRVTVEGKTYEVEVEMLDGAPAGLASAESRVEGGAVLRPPAPVKGNNHSSSPAPASPPPPAKPAAAAPAKPSAPAPAKPEPLPPKPAWHGLGATGEGEVVAPLAGVVTTLHVKVGDAVKVNDPVATIAASAVWSPGSRPLTGTVRAQHAGTVRELPVSAGDAVGAGRVLARIG